MPDAMVPFPTLSGLPRTGQTTEYVSGDDGTYQVGHPSTSRFRDNTNGTITDTLYTPNLMYPKTPHLMIPGAVTGISENTIQRVGPDHGGGVGVWVTGSAYLAGDVVTDGATFAVAPANYTSGGAYATDVSGGDLRITPWIGSAANLTTPGTDLWGDGITNCEALDYAGFTDWRMANIFELVSLYNAEDGTTPSIHSPFVIASNVHFWSSTTRKAASTNASDIIYGSSLQVNIDTKASDSNVIMPVRGGVLNG